MRPRESMRPMFVLPVMVVLGVVPVKAQSSGLKVQCRIDVSAPSDNQIAPLISIVNESTATVTLSTLTVRYWYTAEGNQSQVYWCDYAPFDCENVSSTFVELDPAFSTADTYLELGFTSAAGSLTSGQSTGEIQSRITKSDWGSYDETNDYSYSGSTTTADCDFITLYEDGALVWGLEPQGGSSGEDTQPPTAPTNLTATATTSSSISLSWTASTDNVGVTGYDIYNGTTLAVSVTTTSAVVTGLSSDITYTFSVQAKDAAGNLSDFSESLEVSTLDPTRPQAPYPDVDESTCGSWALTDNVCCARYCSDDNRSENCDSCGGNDSSLCVTVNSKACMSGVWPEVHSVSTSEPWHYSRSTHFGLTSGGACGFGLYGLCTTQSSSVPQCAAFCAAYPDLCADPAGTTLRGNFAAPPGNYYTQFWPSLPGERDNYLSCGECYQVIRTKKDGTDYQPDEDGYTAPITLQLVDSCPCAANSKWCCGSGRDHCGEVSDFEYGCQLPPAPPDPPVDHDPLPNESIHVDLSDIAMSRLQSGYPDGGIIDGVIPIRYQRVPCSVVGNVHIWLRSGASPYYFALSVVNVSGLGSVVNVEAQLPSGTWVSMERDPNYTTSRPQERYGAWVIPQGSGPFSLPVSLRITDPAGNTIVASEVITAWAPEDSSQGEMYYIDTGLQF